MDSTHAWHNPLRDATRRRESVQKQRGANLVAATEEVRHRPRSKVKPDALTESRLAKIEMSKSELPETESKAERPAKIEMRSSTVPPHLADRNRFSNGVVQLL